MKYTKNQIVEAIKYWQNVLDQMNESKSKIIDALIEEFGEEIISKRRLPYGIDQEEIQRIFNVLNRVMFTNALSSIPIKYCNTNQIVAKLNEHLEISKSNAERYKTVNCYGAHSAAFIRKYDNNQKLIDIETFDHIIMINKDTINYQPLMFTVAVVCHEMIHLYASLISSECHKLEIAVIDTTDNNIENNIDFHNTKAFNDMEIYANNNGINVIKSPNGKHEHELTDDAVAVFEQMLDETDNTDVKKSITADETIVITSEKSGMGVITGFFPVCK